MKKIIAVILLIVMTMSLAACGSNKKDSGTDLVKVGDTTINEEQLNQYLELTAFIQNIDLTQFPAESMKAIKSQMLDDMVSIECIKQYYAGKEDKVLPDTIDADLKGFMDEAKNTETVSAFIKEKNISDDTLKNFFYDQYYRKAYFDEVQAGMKTLDKDAKAYYEANKDSFKVDEVTASHILVKDEATAKDILAQLKAGAKFEDMAKQYSIDTTNKDNGGSLGTFGRGQMVKEFEDAAFALKPGEISDVVKTQYGYHIIKVTAKNQGTKTYEEAKDSIISNLVSQEAQKKISELKSSAKIKYLTKDYTRSTQS
jgi:foldase protein PrsA